MNYSVEITSPALAEIEDTSHFSQGIRSPRQSVGMTASEPPSNPYVISQSVVPLPRKMTGMMVYFGSYFMGSDDTFIGFYSRSERKQSSSSASDMGDKNYSDLMSFQMTNLSLQCECRICSSRAIRGRWNRPPEAGA